MSTVQINSSSDSDILKLGIPLLKLSEQTWRLDSRVLSQLDAHVNNYVDGADTITENDYETLGNTIQSILSVNSDAVRYKQTLTVERIRSLFLDFITNGNFFSICSALFDYTPGGVIVITPEYSRYPLGGLGFANMYCPPGSRFLIAPGMHLNNESIHARDNNIWIGVNGSVVDGSESLVTLFEGGMNNNIMTGFSISNYKEFGIYSPYGDISQSVSIHHMTFESIGAELNGQDYGAVMFESSRDIKITDSSFRNVTSGIRFKNSVGPLQVIGNRALNSGRNFFQCGYCLGADIVITENSMEYYQQFGTTPLEDHINIFRSEGTSDSYIEISRNRARGYAINPYSAFIQLGDGGGKYQQAFENIGVNPGQKGIGSSGGHYIVVRDNKMYSNQWEESNVAYASRNATYFTEDLWEPCSNHSYTRNTANWVNRDGIHNNSWAPPKETYSDAARCGIDLTEIRSNTTEDRTLGPEIWDEW